MLRFGAITMRLNFRSKTMAAAWRRIRLSAFSNRSLPIGVGSDPGSGWDCPLRMPSSPVMAGGLQPRARGSIWGADSLSSFRRRKKEWPMTSTSPTPHRNPRVLIVEDESRLRDLLLEEIPDIGFQATAARSGEEARRVMETDAHEIILLDLRLPVMGGMDLLESVRKSWPQTQVVILTGYGDLASAQRAIHLDVVDFLSKPCPLREVELALDRARRRIFSQASEMNSEFVQPAKMESQGDQKAVTLKE